MAQEEVKKRSDSVEITSRFLERKEEYRIKRDLFANNLRRDFLFAEHYFAKDVSKLIKEFIDWHRQYRIATVDQLPQTEE